MTLADRRRARKAAVSPADRELLDRLNSAKRELDQAKGVCGRISRSRSPEDQALAAQARANHTLIEQALVLLNRVSVMTPTLAQDIDLLPEDARTALSREANLKRRAEADSKKRVRAQEAAVANVLASLAVNQ